MKKLLLTTFVLFATLGTNVFGQTPTQEQLLLLEESGIGEIENAENLIQNNTSRERKYSGARPAQQSSPGGSSPIYGSNIFSSKQLSFSPSLRIPTPMNYKIAAGDEIIIVLWGAAEAEYNLEVSPEGNVIIPKVGVLHIAGLSFEVAQGLIRQKLSTTFTGLRDGTVECKVTLGDIRSISVNIV